MTSTEAVKRQAARENAFSCGIRPETVQKIEDVLKRIETVHTLSHREIGALQWDAFAALTQLQADQKVSKEFGI